MFHIFYQACILRARGYTYADRVRRFQSWDGAKSEPNREREKDTQIQTYRR